MSCFPVLLDPITAAVVGGDASHSTVSATTAQPETSRSKSKIIAPRVVKSTDSKQLLQGRNITCNHLSAIDIQLLRPPDFQSDPPSYVAGIKAKKQRQQKITAALLRLQGVYNTKVNLFVW